MARIQIAKATSGAAFVAKKRAAEARLAAQEAGIYVEDDGNENIFELQHHHLLRCLEKTTVRVILVILNNISHLYVMLILFKNSILYKLLLIH